MKITKIKVNTDELRSDAATISGNIQRVTEEINRIEEALRTLNVMWEGPAGDAFIQVCGHDLEQLRTIVETLKKFNAFENNAREKYDNCESEVRDVVNSLRI